MKVSDAIFKGIFACSVALFIVSTAMLIIADNAKGKLPLEKAIFKCSDTGKSGEFYRRYKKDGDEIKTFIIDKSDKDWGWVCYPNRMSFKEAMNPNVLRHTYPVYIPWAIAVLVTLYLFLTGKSKC